MSRSAVAAVVVLLLFTAAVGANAAITADRTAMDGEYVADTFEEEGAYESLTRDVQRDIADNLTGVSDELPPGLELVNFDADEVAVSSLPESYMASEFRGSILGMYAFLHGERETLEMTLDFRPIAENLSAAFGPEQIRVETPVLVEETTTDVDSDPIPTDSETIARLNSDAEGYEEVRLDIRADIALDLLRFDDPDRLLDPVIEDYDPDEYTDGEKQDEIDAREDAIRSNLRISLQTDDQLRDDVETILDERAEEVKDDIEAETAGTGPGDTDRTAEAIADLMKTVVDGVAGDMAFQEYREQLDADEEAVENETAVAIGDEVRNSVPEAVDLAEGFGGEEGSELDDVALAFRWTGRLTWALPLAGLALIGGLYGLTNSPHRAGAIAGKTIAVAGLVGAVAGIALGVFAVDFLEESATPDGAEEAEGLAAGFLAVIENALTVLTVQSIPLLIVGVGLFGLVAADKQGRLDGIRERLGREPYSAPVDEPTDDDTNESTDHDPTGSETAPEPTDEDTTQTESSDKEA